MGAKDRSEIMEGGINSFHNSFIEFKDELKSYLYRLVADRNDCEDLAHDTFLRAFDKLETFKGDSTLKTWVFSIATNLAYNFLKTRKRWAPNILDLARTRAGKSASVRDFLSSATTEPYGSFELKEHINFCFTCISKTIPLEEQLAIILIDIYDFKIKDAALILGKGESAVKHYIRDARNTMNTVYENRCALVNKNGVCHQCSQLNNWLNPINNFNKQKKEIKWIDGKNADKTELFQLRTDLIRNIDPLKAKGANLHENFMRLHRLCAGEINSL